MNNIDITQLSEEQRKDLVKQAKEIAKQEKQQKAQEKALLKELENGVVLENIDFFIDKRGALEDKIQILFGNIDAIIDLRAKVFGNHKREQDSHTFTLDDGSASIKIGWNVRPTFNGTEAEGIVKIKQYMASLVGESENEKILMEFLNIALKTDVQGNYNPQKVRELDRMRNRANSELFNEGMDIINEAILDIRTSRYAKGYKMIDTENGIQKRVNFHFSID